MTEVDNYILKFSEKIQAKLLAIRAVFKELPDFSESIRYGIPSFKVGKQYLYFAAYKKHIGFYPVYGLNDMEADLSPYRAKNTKDTLHFIYNETIPIDLIRRIIEKKRQMN